MTGQVFFTNANAATLLTVVGDKLIDHGASTILENPEQITKGGAEATLGVALKQERTIDFITDSLSYRADALRKSICPLLCDGLCTSRGSIIFFSNFLHVFKICAFL